MTEEMGEGGEVLRQERRRFLIRVGQTLALGVGAALAYRLGFDPQGPLTLSRRAGELRALPSWALAGEAPAMAVARGQGRARMLEAALEALGGISRYVERGDRVLVKVNAAFATPPELGATTHPELVAAVVKLCLRVGAREVIVADNPINDPDSCFRLTGIGAAAAAAGARVVLPRAGSFRPFTLEGATLIRRWPLFYEPLAVATKVIGVAPIKHHNRSGASMSMKNWYGLLGGRRNMFHQDINTIIAELAQLVRPTLVILDGTMVMVSNGPTGGSLSDLVARDTLVVSTDPVAADSFAATLLGRSVRDLPYLAMAERAGCGTTNFEALGPKHVEVGSS